MRRLLLAGAASLALIATAQAEVGFDLATYQRCASLLAAVAEQAPWAKTAAWYQDASSAFVLAAAEERLRLRGEGSLSWLQVKVEAQAVQEALKAQSDAGSQDPQQDPALLEFCTAIGEAIVPVRLDAYQPQ